MHKYVVIPDDIKHLFLDRLSQYFEPDRMCLCVHLAHCKGAGCTWGRGLSACSALCVGQTHKHTQH